ncbi:MAG: DUF6959 family protein [Rhizobiaceae bacterium]
MKIEPVEIYSDQTNAAIMRHPGRRFPGVLVQGDTLYGMCLKADDVCGNLGRESHSFAEANELRNSLWAYLNHYKATLAAHEIKLPFNETHSKL